MSTNVEPELQWLHAESSRNADLVITDAEQLRNARRRLRRILQDSGQQMLYLDHPQALDDFETTLRVENGRLVQHDGPLRQILQRGGTLVLNVARFSPQELESFNTLVEEQIWNGMRLPNKVRVIYLCDSDTLQKARLTGAVISRASFRDMSRHAFPETGDPVPTPTAEGHPPGTQVIDLQGDSNWRFRLFGGPELDSDQNWHMRPPVIDVEALTPLCLRGVPLGDADLMDEIAALIQNGRPVFIEQGLPEADIKKKTANKQALAERDFARLHQHDAPVCLVNAGNLSETLENGYGVANGRLRSHPSILAQVSGHPSGERPIVFVSHAMPESFWDRLMLHDRGFLAAAAAGVPVPSRYENLVTTVDRSVNATNQGLAGSASVATQPVGFLLSADPALATFPADARHVFVTPDTRSDTLISRLTRVQTPNAEQPTFSNDMQQLLIDLMKGETVVLHGLDKNPALVEELAPLLHPPHRLNFNGRQLRFGQGGELNGRLIVATREQALLDTHCLSLVYRDGIGNDEERWKGAVLSKLTAAFPHEDRGRLRTRLESLLELLDRMPGQEMHASRPFPASYQMIEKLFRHFPDNAPAARDGSDDGQRRIQRAVFKDILIGDYRQFDLNADERYAYLKAMLKVMFPEEISSMAPKTVDIERLQSLLARVDHPKDIIGNAWQFINVFSEDVIWAIASQPAAARGGSEAAEAVGRMVLTLVLCIAGHHGLVLPRLFDKAVAKGQADAAKLDAKIWPLTGHNRPPGQEPGQKLLNKVEETRRRSKALFFKGPPGSGKTHVASRIGTDERQPAWIAATGTAADVSILKQWANAANPPPLIIDEANLANEGSHDMFRGMLAEGTMLIDGRRYTLGEEHRVIFTGNADDYPGRSRHDIAADAFATVIFKPSGTDELRDIFVRPLVGKALPPSLPKKIFHKLGVEPTYMKLKSILHAQPAGFKEYIAHHAVEVHAALQRAYPERGFSVRNLEEYVTQVLCSLKSKAAPASREELAPWMARLALDVYAGCLPADDRPVIEAWLRRRFNMTANIALPSLPRAKLKSDSLVPTASARELGDRINWWLDSQKKRRQFNPKPNALGQQALLIEGPASRGKDETVKAVLEAGKYRYLHVNANPRNPGQLEEDVARARQDGSVLVVSELTLYNSGDIERILNPVLTGDLPAHPDFRLIITVNPVGYAGRKPMSPALENRMQKLAVDPYDQSELFEIAQGTAQRLRKRTLHQLAARFRRSGDGIQLPSLAPETVDKLVNLHVELDNRLAAYSEEHRPKIRELKASIKLLSRSPASELDTIFQKNYAYYLGLAGGSGGAGLNLARESDSDARTRLTHQLLSALTLAYPYRLSQPGFVFTRASETAVRYDIERHCLEIDPERPVGELCTEMLSLAENAFELPVEERSLTNDSEEEPPARVAPDETPQSAQPSSFNPASAIRSGVGMPDLEGYIGTVYHKQGEQTYLNAVRATLDGQRFPFRPEQFDEQTDVASRASPVPMPLVELENVSVDHHASGVPIVYLLATSDTRPTEVIIDGKHAATVYRDEHGGWYVRAGDAPRTSVARLTYRLTGYHDTTMETAKGKGKEVLFNKLRLAQASTSSAPEAEVDIGNADSAIEAIEQLRNRAGKEEMSETRIADSLKIIFNNPKFFSYSDDDAQALNAAPNAAARLNHFLRHGKGVCAEFAETYAAVLEQAFGIATRQCSGYCVVTDRIPAQSHQWVEYADAAGHWHRIDPTPASRPDEPANRQEPPLIEPSIGGPTEPPAATAAGRNITLTTQTWISLAPYDELKIDPQFLNTHFSPGKLGLEYWDMQNDKDKFNAYSGELVLKRMLEGKPDMFRKAGANALMRYRRVYIESLPMMQGEASQQKWFESLVKLFRPVQALIDSGVPVFIHDRNGNPVQIDSAEDLQRSVPLQASTRKTRPGDEGTIIVGQVNRDFFDKLTSAYYNAVLGFTKTEVERPEAVKKALFTDLFPILTQSKAAGIDAMTIRLTLNGSDYAITPEDMERKNAELEDSEASRIQTLYGRILREGQEGRADHSVMRQLDDLMTRNHIANMPATDRLSYSMSIASSITKSHDDTFKTWALRHMHTLVHRITLTDDKAGDFVALLVHELLRLLEDERIRFNNEEHMNRFLMLLHSLPAKSIDDEDTLQSLEHWQTEILPLDEMPLDETMKSKLVISLEKLRKQPISQPKRSAP